MKFVTDLATIWLKQKRLPDKNEVRVAYRTSVRGGAKVEHEVKIDLEGLIDSFATVGAEMAKLHDDQMVSDLIAGFARQAAERLDKAVAGIE